MTIKLNDERNLRRAMQPPALSAPPSLAVLEERAARIRRRRRVRLVSGSVGAGVVAAALAAAGPLHLIGYGPGAAGEVPICTPAELTYYSGEAFGIEPEALPASMRLGWTSDTLPPMGWGVARRIEHPCAHAPIHRLIDLENGVVTRTVDLNATPLITSTGDLQAGEPPVATQSNGNGVYPTTSDPSQAEIRRQGGYLVAAWLHDDHLYEVWGRGITLAQMQSLLESLRTSGLTIDASRWPSAVDFEAKVTTAVPPDGREFSWMVASEQRDGEQAAVDLEVAEDSDDLMLHAEVGDTRVLVGGRPGIQSRDGTVTWKPNEGTIAFLDGSSDDAELLAAAQMVTTLGSDALPHD